MTLKIGQYPRIPLCIRPVCWNKIILPLSLKNIPRSKKRTRKERTGQLSHYRDGKTMYIESEKDRVTVVFSTVFKDDNDMVIGKVFMQEFKEGCRASPTGPLLPQGTSSGAERHQCCCGWQHCLHYLHAAPLPHQCQRLRQHHQPDPCVLGLCTTTPSALRPIFTHIGRQNHLTSSRYWTVYVRCQEEKKWKQSRGRCFHPSNS